MAAFHGGFVIIKCNWEQWIQHIWNMVWNLIKKKFRFIWLKRILLKNNSKVDRFFDNLIPLLVPLQYNGYGGPIIDIQVEDDTTIDVPVSVTHQYYSYLKDGLFFLFFFLFICLFVCFAFFILFFLQTLFFFF